jgi:hypothetical protein
MVEMIDAAIDERSHSDQTLLSNHRPDRSVGKIFPEPGIGGETTGEPFRLHGNAHNHLAQIVYNESNGFLYYDSNGDLPGGQTHFARLAGHPQVGAGALVIEA